MQRAFAEHNESAEEPILVRVGLNADKQIAIEPGISPLAAQKHTSNILSKMGASSRTEASVRAVREGLLD